jgi:hypothetical protein
MRRRIYLDRNDSAYMIFSVLNILPAWNAVNMVAGRWALVPITTWRKAEKIKKIFTKGLIDETLYSNLNTY